MKKHSSEDTSIPFDWLLGTKAYEKPIYEPQDSPQLLIPRNIALHKPFVVRETLKAAATRQEKKDDELYGLNQQLTIIGNNESISRAPSRGDSRATPHPVTPRFFASSCTLISQASELEQLKAKKKKQFQKSHHAQLKEKKSSIEAYRLRLASKTPKSIENPIKNEIELKQSQQQQHSISSRKDQLQKNNFNSNYKSKQRSRNGSSSNQCDFEVEFAVLFNNANLQQNQSIYQNTETNSNQQQQQSSNQTKNLNNSNQNNNETSSGLLKPIAINSVSNWAASGLEENEPFVIQQELLILKGKEDDGMSSVGGEKQSQEYLFDNNDDFVDNNDDLHFQNEIGDLVNNEEFLNNDIRNSLDELPNKNYGENYLFDFDHHTNRSGIASPNNHQIVIQKFREQIFPTNEKFIKRNRGIIGGNSVIRKVNDHVSKQQFRMDEYDENHHYRKDKANLGVSYRPPLLRSQYHHQQIKQRSAPDISSGSPNSKHSDVDAISEFVGEFNIGSNANSGFSNSHLPPSPSHQEIDSQSQLFSAFLGPVPTHSSNIEDKSNFGGCIKNKQEMLHTVRIASQGDGAGSYSPTSGHSSSIAASVDSSSSSTMTLQNSPDRNNIYPVVAFGSRAIHHSSTISLASIQGPSSSSSCQNNTDQVEGDNIVWRKSLGSLKPLQGDHTNLSDEDAAAFAASYQEWMIAEVNSPVAKTATSDDGISTGNGSNKLFRKQEGTVPNVQSVESSSSISSRPGTDHHHHGNRNNPSIMTSIVTASEDLSIITPLSSNKPPKPRKQTSRRRLSPAQ